MAKGRNKKRQRELSKQKKARKKQNQGQQGPRTVPSTSYISVEHPRGRKRNFMIFGLAALVFSAIGGVECYRRSRSEYDSDSSSYSTPVEAQAAEVVDVPVEIPSEISFEQAVRNEHWRQSYLEQLVEEEAKVEEFWTGFGRIVYDPNFKIHDEETGRNTNMGNNEAYGRIKVSKGKISVPIAKTYVEEKGKKPPVYFCHLGFRKDIVSCEDELKSLLDNEAFHAYETMTRKVPLKIKSELSEEEVDKILKSASGDIPRLALELLSFDYQYYNILKKKRVVSKNFVDKFMRSYFGLYREFEELSDKESNNGKFAKLVFSSLVVKLNYSEIRDE
ncbi:hypothetical protein GOV06_01920 [Candidatus Woesearchaeota archaeon]|nr:hypothetical protein [Candidatus Woesearchaeota archaeon]